jgi:hypothetical protein
MPVLGRLALIIYLASTLALVGLGFAAVTGGFPWLHFFDYGYIALTGGLPLLQTASLLTLFRCRGPAIPFIDSMILSAPLWPVRIFIVLTATVRMLRQIIGFFRGDAWWPGLLLDFALLAMMESMIMHLAPEGAIYDAERHRSARLVWGRIKGTRL